MNTIFALSSAQGRSGLAVIRLSGPEALGSLQDFTGQSDWPARKARLCLFKDPEAGEALDEGIALFFPQPKSFTGEDVVEFHVHGGLAVISGLLGALGRRPGLRPAEPGEFTRRAFDNGRLDLSEVEGLSDLIAAETEGQRTQALRQMRGGLSHLVETWRNRLLEASALSEAMIDFSDEELPADIEGRLCAEISSVRSEIQEHLKASALGERLRHGFEVAIIGPPNAGKSSLLNALVKREAAIVTDVAGTTRDVLEAHLDVAGYPVVLADTAGLREVQLSEGASPLEKAGLRIEEEGMLRARRRAEDADVVLMVFDGGHLEERERSEWARWRDKAVLVINKLDLLEPCEKEKVLALDHSEKEGLPTFGLSALSGMGLEALVDYLSQRVISEFSVSANVAVVTRERHRKALLDCSEALERAAMAKLPELMAEDLRHAMGALGRILGRNDIEDILDRIFSEFCIGK